MNTEELLGYFGYEPKKKKQGKNWYGCWRRERVQRWLGALADFFEKEKLENKKFRIVVDYDPELGQALCQIEVQDGEPSL